MQSDLDLRARSIHQLEVTNSALRDKLTAAELKLEEAEWFSKHENLIIYGIPAMLSEIAVAGSNRKHNVESSLTSITKVLEFCNNTLAVPIREPDVLITHRLRAGNATHPALLVRFTRHVVRENVLRAATAKLQGFNANRPQPDGIYPSQQCLEIAECCSIRCSIEKYSWCLNKELRRYG